MTANLMPVRGHVPTKFELQYTVIDHIANQTTKMRSYFGCYHDALEIIFGLYDLLLELCSLQKSNPNRAMKFLEFKYSKKYRNKFYKEIKGAKPCIS